MEIKLVSQKFRIIEVTKKTKAYGWSELKPGFELQFSFIPTNNTSGNGRVYQSYIKILVHDPSKNAWMNFKCSISKFMFYLDNLVLTFIE